MRRSAFKPREADGSADLDGLRAAFAGRLIVEPGALAPFLIDWRQTWRGVAIAVAQPDTAEGVAAVVRWCAENGIAIVPQGGNTSQSGGSVPNASGTNLVLSLARLNRIRSVDPDNDTITVDAGCILATIQAAAADAGRLFPLSLGAEGSCTIGGNLATNAGGTAVLRYGNARELCLGVEVVTASGEVWDGLKGLRKDNSGYDLRDLFIGSEGTLGIITGAVLKLVPAPVARHVAFVAVPDCQAAMALFGALRKAHDSGLTAFELMSEQCMALVLEAFADTRRPFVTVAPWYVLIELSDFRGGDDLRSALERSLGGAIEQGMIADATIAESLTQGAALWGLRERISQAQAADGGGIKHDIAVPLSRIAAFVEEALSAVCRRYPDIRPVVFGHLGDGNLHFNFSSAPGADQAAFRGEQESVNAIVHDIVRAHRGTISAEHGLGMLGRDEAHAHRSPVERAMMGAIKQALDPAGIMNPGKLLGDAIS